jgi:hypothetical protein
MEENNTTLVIVLGFALMCIIFGAADIYIGSSYDGPSRMPKGWWGIGLGVLVMISVFYEKYLSKD